MIPTEEESVAEVNLPEVVAEVAAVFAAYEDALVANDVEAMRDAFWDSPLTVRYGVGERQYGAEQIDEWRRSAAPLPPGRSVGPTTIATFGRDVAYVSTEFRYPGRESVGRQTQTWVRLPAGWRVVGAHVSIELQPAG
jgi:ketosteroid isomerase-like protein